MALIPKVQDQISVFQAGGLQLNKNLDRSNQTIVGLTPIDT